MSGRLGVATAARRGGGRVILALFVLLAIAAGVPGARAVDDTGVRLAALDPASVSGAPGSANGDSTALVARMQQRLRAAREAQIAAARAALLTAPATRHLALSGPPGALVDTKQEPASCRITPTARCLLAEALASAQDTHTARFSDWILGDILAVLVGAGKTDTAMAASAASAIRDWSSARLALSPGHRPRPGRSRQRSQRRQAFPTEPGRPRRWRQRRSPSGAWANARGHGRHRSGCARFSRTPRQKRVPSRY